MKHNTIESAALPPIEKVEIGSRGEFIVNGEPFIPLMSWLQEPESEYSSFSYLKSLNFNTFMGTTKISHHWNMVKRLKAGGYAVVSQHNPEQVSEAAGHPYICLASSGRTGHADEKRRRVYEARHDPEMIRERYQFLRDNNIVRPVLLHSPHIS